MASDSSVRLLHKHEPFKKMQQLVIILTKNLTVKPKIQGNLHVTLPSILGKNNMYEHM